MSFFRPLENPEVRVISLGAGVQSSVLALMGDQGLLGEKPDCAIFADTGWEPDGVYEHLEWLKTQLSYPVYTVQHGNIRDDMLNEDGSRKRVAGAPFFTANGGMGRRQCTREYKIDPIRKKERELIGLKPRQRAPSEPVVEVWIGISCDEIQRIKESRDKWAHNRWPLIEKRMNREDCKRWFSENYPGRYLPRSACIACPYKSDHEWRLMRDTDPKSWADAVAFDAALRVTDRKMENDEYVHRSLKPLSEVDLSTPEDHGQISFLDECDGMCGL